MKFLHLSDLHLGKRVRNFSMLEDQKYILSQVLSVIDEEKITSIIIAGDVYDKAVPPTEAVALFDEFLVQLEKRKLNVFVISGNHDSPERIAFGEKIMQNSHIYISPVYKGEIVPVTLEDEYGQLNVYMLPFVKPLHVRHFCKDEKAEDYTAAVKCVTDRMKIDTKIRNILVCHQFVTGAVRSDSEEISVGGLDNVDASVFKDFDYVALGHIHNPQNIGSEKIRYCGTLLKYSFAETEKKKSITIVEMGKKGDVHIKVRELSPLRDFISVRGYFDDLVKGKNKVVEDYAKITLLDEWDIPNAFGRLVNVYPNLMQVSYERYRTMNSGEDILNREETKVAPDDLFARFYEDMNNQPLTKEQKKYITDVIEEIWGNGNETY